MSQPDYDVIVVGAGLAGLTCGALLAKHGQRVLIIEQNTRLGGYATSYVSQDHHFDIATQALGGCDPAGPVYRVLDELGVADKVSFLPCTPARVYYYDHQEPYIQHGQYQDQLAMLTVRFPKHRDALVNCFETWRGIYAELESIASLTHDRRSFGFARNFPLLARYGRATVEDFFTELDLPPALRKLLSARASYCLLPLDRLSLVGFACTEISYGAGAWMVEGGVVQLSKAIAKGFARFGGSILNHTTVSAIYTEGKQVTGVSTSSGAKISCRQLVVACDARRAILNWLDDPDLLPKAFLRKLAHMEPSGSYYVSYYRVPVDTVAGMYPNIEVRNDMTDRATTNGAPVYYVLIPSMVDRNSAPSGYHSLCLSIPLPPGKTLDAAARKTIRQNLEKAVVLKFPALAGQLRWLFELSPGQLAAMTGNPGGSAYGWALTPEQAGIYRLNVRTPVDGLYLAGHWTMPGGGIAGVMISGRLCGQAIIDDLAG